MEEQTIMICTEKLDVGGVETVVCNQAIALKNKGYRVVLLAEEGIHTSYLEQNGIICIPFSFPLENVYNLENAYRLVEIAKQYKVLEIHVHKLPCITTIVPVSILCDIPYIAYIHVNIEGIYEWYQRSYEIYNRAFKIFYRNASKVIAISESAKKRAMNVFDIPEEKCMVIYNSVAISNYEKYHHNSDEKIEKFLILSRFLGEKMKSITNAIDLFITYLEKTKSNTATLSIIGGGPEKDKIEEYVKQVGKEDSIQLLDGINNVPEVMANYDVVIGIDRSVLEALAMKKITIISGYEEVKELVTKANIQQAMLDNFSGRNLEVHSIQEIVEQLIALTKEEITKIEEENYDFVQTQLNVANNIYLFSQDTQRQPITIQKEQILQDWIETEKAFAKEKEQNQIRLEEKEREIVRLQELQFNQKEKNRKRKEEVIRLEEENREYQMALEEIYNSKRWRYTEKIMHVLRKEKK